MTPARSIVLRFPPEPNGYLHIGHAKAIYLNFELAKQHGGICRLRFDDTDPTQEEHTYVRAIEEDITWLGYQWAGKSRYTSDYFSQLHEWAMLLIRKGKAYVDKNDPEAFNNLYRGTVDTPGTESPFRAQGVAENLALFEEMRKGNLPEGRAVLRAKIDMQAPNILLRDPVIYRVKKQRHFKEEDRWCIYPMYDFSHPLSDAIEGVTHSLCTLEFAPHRPLYDWFIKAVGPAVAPRQIEFSRLNLSHAITSKRRITQLIEKGYVTGWDDPKLPTLAGLRRRGYTPRAIRLFVEKAGISKRENLINYALLEWCLREELNRTALRKMVVLRPIVLIITNYPEGKVEWIEAVNNPENPQAGRRKVPFTNRLYIEQEDFMEDPPPKFFRLAVGREVRLKYAYIVRCEKVVTDASGLREVHVTYDPKSKSGSQTAQRKVKGTIHWVSAQHSQQAEVRLYQPLFSVENPAELSENEWKKAINPHAQEALSSAQAEPSLREATGGCCYQFERQGYFCLEAPVKGHMPIFHRSVSLRDNKKKQMQP